LSEFKKTNTLRLKTLVQLCHHHSHLLRNQLYKKTESSLYYFSETLDLPVLNEEQYKEQVVFQRECREADLEVVRTGGTGRVLEIEERRGVLNEEIDLLVRYSCFVLFVVCFLLAVVYLMNEIYIYTHDEHAHPI
jgi:hypothetical protein